LLWFVTGLCIAGYLGIVIEAAWHRPYLAVGIKSWLAFTLGLLILAFVQHQVLRRLRAAMPTIHEPILSSSGVDLSNLSVQAAAEAY
jgi:hypothetical protein